MRVLIVSDDPKKFPPLEEMLSWLYEDVSVERQDLQALLAEIGPENAGLRPSIDYSANAPELAIIRASYGGMELAPRLVSGLHSRYPMTQIILVGNEDLKNAAKALRLGATDYINTEPLPLWRNLLAERIRLWQEFAMQNAEADASSGRIGLK